MYPRASRSSGWIWGSQWQAAGTLITAIAIAAWQHASIGAPALELAVPKSPLAARSQPTAVTAETLPPHVDVETPFITQAPNGDWSEPYGEACEEASVAMALAWSRGEALSPIDADSYIRRLVEFENYHFGYNADTALRETLKLITRAGRHKNAILLYDINRDDIRRALADGNIVIAPVAGALLKNPFYSVPPPYHMLVIRGYDDMTQEFITNDPGTKNGEKYRYSYDVLERAIHDWTGSDRTILSGRKGIIVTSK